MLGTGRRVTTGCCPESLTDRMQLKIVISPYYKLSFRKKYNKLKLFSEKSTALVVIAHLRIHPTIISLNLDYYSLHL